jgi:N-acetylglucosaminylphosphatidylinositol deacetylase
MQCTTTGDADGLGEIRKKELVKSGLQLGIGHKDDIMIIEDKSVRRPLCAGKQNR